MFRQYFKKNLLFVAVLMLVATQTTVLKAMENITQSKSNTQYDDENDHYQGKLDTFLLEDEDTNKKTKENMRKQFIEAKKMMLELFKKNDVSNELIKNLNNITSMRLMLLYCIATALKMNDVELYKQIKMNLKRARKIHYKASFPF